ncbi:MAG TPA: DUF6600 domain-containing protein, partial [Blastocatellia bacterium]|nr:DUF6600 domain-containing protein [Blastocatellia bacterium]
MFSIKRIFSALGAAALLATIVVADPPARVARINYLQGPVSLQRGDLGAWDQAVINNPMVANDSLWTDDHARAELHIGSTALRLADQTSISFLNLNDQAVQIRLAKGVVELHLNRLDPAESYEIDTPCASASLSQTGDYRLEVDEAGDTTIITRRGQAEVTVGLSPFDVAAGQQANVSNSADPIYELSPPKPIDDFERWANERTRREDQCVSARYVSREMIGYEDLDAYGGWTVLPEYGNAWSPYSVPAGWAPYSAGNWLWLEPYGWTWVDVEPWGFAPFHYGRWAFVGGAWYWVPGPLAPRPIFAPALVSFIGGNNWGVSFGFGPGIGWFPLGPGEIYRPVYFVSERYIRGLNPTLGLNVRVVNRFVNREVPGAVTVVTREVFTRGRIDAVSRVRIEPRMLADAPLLGAAAPLAPARESLLVRGGHGGVVARPPDFVRERIVRTKLAPAPNAIPFAARRSALTANPGRPLDAPTLRRIRGAAPDRHFPGGMPTRPANPPNAHAPEPRLLRPVNPPLMRGPEPRFETPVRPNNPSGIRPERTAPMRPTQRPEHGNGFNVRH